MGGVSPGKVMGGGQVVPAQGALRLLETARRRKSDVRTSGEVAGGGDVSRAGPLQVFEPPHRDSILR